MGQSYLKTTFAAHRLMFGVCGFYVNHLWLAGVTIKDVYFVYPICSSCRWRIWQIANCRNLVLSIAIHLDNLDTIYKSNRVQKIRNGNKNRQNLIVYANNETKSRVPCAKKSAAMLIYRNEELFGWICRLRQALAIFQCWEKEYIELMFSVCQMFYINVV